MRPFYLFFILIALNFFFFIGGNNYRQKKANFLASKIFFPFFNSIKNFQDKRDLLQENYHLRKKLADSSLKLFNLQNYINKTKKISKINLRSNFDYIIAEVVGKGSVFYDNTLIIDKGKADGVKTNYPVIDFKGIIGKIISVGYDYSVVLPYSNSSFGLSVMLKKNNQQGILKSDAVGNVFVDYLDLNAEVSVGDTIVTSNLSEIFPTGFLVGRVKKIKISKDRMHKVADLEMFNNAGAVTTVIILKYKKDEYYEKAKQGIDS